MITATFVVVEVGERHVGVFRGAVARIAPAADWTGPPPIRLEPSPAFHADAEERRRVLVVQTPRGPRALSTTSPLVVQEFVASRVFPLPRELWPLGARPLVSHVAVDEGRGPLLVLCPDAIGDDLPIPSLSGDPT